MFGDGAAAAGFSSKYRARDVHTSGGEQFLLAADSTWENVKFAGRSRCLGPLHGQREKAGQKAAGMGHIFLPRLPGE